ncbi:uncharacterized protein [Physcomitrium patens]|uniref:uncharacterized protein isoform X1 n=1 Tax=Physcomitrium patens TaxID=3218 RepID=UPI003CCD2CBB
MAPPTPLSREQQSVLELTQLAGLDIREDAFLIICFSCSSGVIEFDRTSLMKQLWELMQSDVAPMLVLQLLKSLAGVGPDATPPAESPSESGS